MFFVLPIIAAIFAIPFILWSRRKREFYLFVFVVGLITIITCFRNPMLFPDMINYESYFYTGEYFYTYMGESINIGYELLNKFLRPLESFQLYVVFITIFMLCCYYRTIYKFSPYLLLSLFIFILVDYLFSCFLLRQYMALATTLLSIPFIINRKLIKFLICMAIALSFHTSSIIFIPLYFLYRTNITKSTKFSTSLIFCLSIIFGGVLLLFVSPYLGNYQRYIGWGEEGSVARLVIKIFLLLIYYYALKDKIWQKGINQVILLCMLMAIVVCAWGINIFIFFRLRMYFSVSEFVGIPIILKYNKLNHTSKRFLVNMMVLVYIVILAISYHGFVINKSNPIAYEFLWK